jgi:amidase
MTSNSIVDWRATALSQAIHSRTVSCREVMAAFLAQIDRLNPTHNAIVSRVDPALLMAQAGDRDRALDAGRSMGWMHGFPLAIKDLSATVGVPTTMGSPLLVGNVPESDSIMVERMKAAGGIVIGKSNTPEFGLGSHTYNTVFGATRNAWNPERSAGGSSGGAAVALALRMLPVADGSDMMGSLRNPAGFNHVFGLRPSQGLVPHGPLGEQFVAQLGTEGPMARNVDDLAHLLAVQAGRDARAPLSVAGQWLTGPLDLSQSKGRLRIGWLGDLDGYLPVEDGILALCESALGRLAADGCAVEPIALDYDPVRPWQTWLTLRAWIVTGNLSMYSRTEAQRARLKPEALWEIGQGDGLSAARVFAACAERTAFYQHLRRLLERYDALALPAAQVWPFPVEQTWPREVAGRPMDTYHRWMEVVIYATLAGLPAISVPAGFGSNGLPMGLQLIGGPQADLALLRLAKRYEDLAGDLLAERPPGV